MNEIIVVNEERFGTVGYHNLAHCAPILSFSSRDVSSNRVNGPSDRGRINIMNHVTRILDDMQH